MLSCRYTSSQASEYLGLPKMRASSVITYDVVGGIAQSVLCRAGRPAWWSASRVRPSEEPPVEGISPQELTCVLTPIPKILSDEIVDQGLVCAYMHSSFHHAVWSCQSCPRWVNATNKNTPSIHSRRQNEATSTVGLKKMVAYARISPKI